MTDKRMTDRMFFETLLTLDDVIANPDLVERINHKLEVLDKKNASKKPTERQVANKGILSDIVALMTEEYNRLFSITELIKEIPSCNGLSNQKVAAIIRPALGDTIERVVDGRKTYFRIMPQ